MSVRTLWHIAAGVLDALGRHLTGAPPVKCARCGDQPGGCRVCARGVAE